MKIITYDLENGAEIDYVDLAYLKTERDARNLIKKLVNSLNLIIIKYNCDLYSVSLEYSTGTSFVK